MLLILETVVIDQVVFACQFSWEPNGDLKNDENTAISIKNHSRLQNRGCRFERAEWSPRKGWDSIRRWTTSWSCPWRNLIAGSCPAENTFCHNLKNVEKRTITAVGDEFEAFRIEGPIEQLILLFFFKEKSTKILLLVRRAETNFLAETRSKDVESFVGQIDEEKQRIEALIRLLNKQKINNLCKRGEV